MTNWNELKNALTFNGLIRDEWIPESIQSRLPLYDTDDAKAYANAREYMRKIFKNVKPEMSASYFAEAAFEDYINMHIRLGNCSHEDVAENHDLLYSRFCERQHGEEWIKEDWSFDWHGDDAEEIEKSLVPLVNYLRDNGSFDALEAGVPVEDVFA